MPPHVLLEPDAAVCRLKDLPNTCLPMPHDEVAARPQHVVVLGAGLAGLACAERLVELGHSVDVLEARARVGGRVKSVSLGGGRVAEAGAEFIGRGHATWQRLARTHGLELHPTDEIGDDALWRSGHHVRGAERDALRGMLQRLDGALEHLAADVDVARPWRGARERAADAQSLAQWLQRWAPERGPSHQALRAHVESLNGVPAQRQSLLAHLCQIKGGGLADYWTESQNERCVGGNAQLPLALAARLGPQVVHLRRIAVGLASGPGVRPCVGVAGGATIRPDAVVVTTPPPTWTQLTGIDVLLPRRPQLSTSVKHVLKLERPLPAPQPTHVALGPTGTLFEAWPVGSGEDVHAMVAFVPIRERLRPVGLLCALDRCLQPGRPSAPIAWTRQSFDWNEAPFTQGGYAFAAPSEITALGERLDALQNGIAFAGDWSQYSHAGYMEEALRAGLRAAARVDGAGDGKLDGVAARA